MDLVKLTETIIKKIVSDPESVSIKEFETEEDNTIQIEVLSLSAFSPAHLPCFFPKASAKLIQVF